MPRTLLLADDSATIQRVIELTFADEDIRVIAFSDGDHAIAALDQTPPDIVLADIGMPGKTGYEVARHIKQTPALAHIPVLLLTGAFEPVDAKMAADAGCDGILTKPFDPQLVINRVKELLAKPRPGTKAAEVESYFEQLDQAFANLPVTPVPSGALDEFSADGNGSKVHDVPDVVQRAQPPALADAFSALLAAERSGGGPVAAAADRSLVQSPLPAEELIERVVRRVLERLSDEVVRETVSGIVAATTERLVREEIERIKSNIK